jgi:transcription initiation factor TFIID subunit TAF12
MGATLTDSVKKRESFGPNTTAQLNATLPAQRNKTQEGLFNAPSSSGNSREALTSFKEMRESMNNTAKLSQFKEPALRYPKIHIGPFNSQCLFC